MIKVHHLQNSRSQRVLWLLEELEQPYEVVRYERDPATLLAPEALKRIHPLGKSPVVEDGGEIFAETGAIIEHLIEAYGGGRALKPTAAADLKRYTYWMFYAEGSAMPPLLLKLVFARMPDQTPWLIRPIARKIAEGAQSQLIDPQLRTHVDFWEQELGKTAWFAGNAFSAADIQMSFPLEIVANRRLGLGPNSQAFVERIHERPAYRRALEQGGPYAYA
jgi:glutathione S-transferase